jgi:putative peptidoglycan lipid II flippase
VLRSILSVGAWTLLSRATGFVRDIVMAAILGTGPMADAFVVAFKLPNHFRAIFGEGAFNSAFVPAYSRVREQSGEAAAAAFQGRIASLLLLSQAVLLALAYLFTPEMVRLLAPGFGEAGDRFDLAVELTRITFPYLALITLATLYGGVLNANRRFAAAAAAPVLLNVALVAALLMHRMFPTAAHAAAWGVAVSGLLQLGLLMIATRRAGALAFPKALRLDEPVRRFFKALGPATIGSMGVQIAMFADTIIATLLPAGAVSALYYADRIYQLPLGVIGIAAGTVILPEMSRLLAAGHPKAAHAAQNRTILLTSVMTAPFVVAFLVVPDLIMHALFVRGAFTAEAADAAGSALMAYGFGLPAIVLIRSAVASFYARGDTATPLWASLTAVGVNVVFKILLMGPLQQAGLALATSIGAWANLGLLVFLAVRRDAMAPDKRFLRAMGGIAVAAGAMALVMALLLPRIGVAGAGEVVRLVLVGGCSGLVYAALAALALYLGGFRLRRPRSAAPANAPLGPAGSPGIPPEPPLG